VVINSQVYLYEKAEKHRVSVTYLKWEQVWSVFTKLAARKGYTQPDGDALGCYNPATGDYIRLGKIMGHNVTLIEKGISQVFPFSVLEEWTKRNETIQYFHKRQDTN